jgi:hypothetical protein
MPTKRIKFLHREKIMQSDIEIRLEVLGPAKRFSAKLNLAEYKFPAEAKVYVDAKQLLERIRFDYGTIGRLNSTASFDISRLKGERVTFDVLVVDLSNSRKIGAAETVRPIKTGDAPNGPKELLPIDASRPLGGVLWKVEYTENWDGASDAPVLLLDRTATRGSAANFVSNHWVRSLVFPAVMREILTKILLLDGHSYDKDSTTWRDAWLRFASKIDGQEPPIYEEEQELPSEEITNWIDLAVDKMATKAQLVSTLLAEIDR